VRLVELQTSYHHGRSIDARTIAEDELHGRPVDPPRRGLPVRVGVRAAHLPHRTGLRVWGGVGQDRNNRDDEAHNRATLGLAATNVFGSGFDLSTSSTRFDRPTGDYSSWSGSLGRSFGRASTSPPSTAPP